MGLALLQLACSVAPLSENDAHSLVHPLLPPPRSPSSTPSFPHFNALLCPCSYQDRGLIPRALSRIFASFKARPSCQFQVYISYLELYNEAGYDLLDPSHESKALEELP